MSPRNLFHFVTNQTIWLYPSLQIRHGKHKINGVDFNHNKLVDNRSNTLSSEFHPVDSTTVLRLSPFLFLPFHYVHITNIYIFNNTKKNG